MVPELGFGGNNHMKFTFLKVLFFKKKKIELVGLVGWSRGRFRKNKKKCFHNSMNMDTVACLF